MMQQITVSECLGDCPLVFSLVLTHTHTQRFALSEPFFKTFLDQVIVISLTAIIPKEPIISSARDFLSLPKELEALHQ